MARPRKTVKVSDLVEYANRALAFSPDEDTEGRQGISHMVEHFLMETDNYRGFTWVRKGGERVPAEVVRADREFPPTTYDHTRRYYFYREA